MKKNLIILTLAILIALPVFGLAVEATTPETTEVQETETTPTAPYGGQHGRRWNQTAPGTTDPQAGFVDDDNGGVCDICGNGQGKNPDAPNFLDENEDGVCDHFDTDRQGQGARGPQAMRGRMQQMMGRMQNAQGRRQGMMGRGQQGQGNVQGRNYADTNNDGVCDHFGTDLQRNFGPGRNRR